MLLDGHTRLLRDLVQLEHHGHLLGTLLPALVQPFRRVEAHRVFLHLADGLGAARELLLGAQDHHQSFRLADGLLDLLQEVEPHRVRSAIKKLYAFSSIIQKRTGTWRSRAEPSRSWATRRWFFRFWPIRNKKPCLATSRNIYPSSHAPALVFIIFY